MNHSISGIVLNIDRNTETAYGPLVEVLFILLLLLDKMIIGLFQIFMIWSTVVPLLNKHSTAKTSENRNFCFFSSVYCKWVLYLYHVFVTTFNAIFHFLIFFTFAHLLKQAVVKFIKMIRSTVIPTPNSEHSTLEKQTWLRLQGCRNGTLLVEEEYGTSSNLSHQS